MAETENVDLEILEQAAEIFRGFGHPIRICIIEALAKKKLRVIDLAHKTNYSQSIVSQQLKILRSAGIVKRIKGDKSLLFELTDQHFAYIIKCMRGCIRM